MRRELTEWSCDRCGVVVEANRTDQPKGWTGYTFARTPEGGYDRRRHLCGICSAGIEAYLETRPTTVELEEAGRDDLYTEEELEATRSDT